MLSLQINNPNLEEKFFDFILISYNHMKLQESLERSIKQAKLQKSGEIKNISLDELIDELKNN